VRAGLKRINVSAALSVRLSAVSHLLSAVSRVGVARRVALVLWLALLAASAQAARAQSSIFNAPSTDVIPTHEL
jgi:hypothetical protein